MLQQKYAILIPTANIDDGDGYELWFDRHESEGTQNDVYNDKVFDVCNEVVLSCKT